MIHEDKTTEAALRTAIAALDHAAAIGARPGGPMDVDRAAAILRGLAPAYAPTPGDAPAHARARTPLQAQCGNCRMTWPVMSVPAPAETLATCGLRLSKCPRCFATENISLIDG